MRRVGARLLHRLPQPSPRLRRHVPRPPHQLGRWSPRRSDPRSARRRVGTHGPGAARACRFSARQAAARLLGRGEPQFAEAHLGQVEPRERLDHEPARVDLVPAVRELRRRRVRRGGCCAAPRRRSRTPATAGWWPSCRSGAARSGGRSRSPPPSRRGSSSRGRTRRAARPASRTRRTAIAVPSSSPSERPVEQPPVPAASGRGPWRTCRCCAGRAPRDRYIARFRICTVCPAADRGGVRVVRRVGVAWCLRCTATHSRTLMPGAQPDERLEHRVSGSGRT